MKNLIFIVPLLALSACLKERGVNFEDLNLKEALAKASEDNKNVLIETFSDGWGSCKVLDRVVFKNEKVGNYINGKYVSIKEYIQKDKESFINTHYTIKGNPTVLLLNSDGNEIDRIVGFGINIKESENIARDKYFRTIKDYSENKNSFSYYLAKYKKKPVDIEINYQLGKKYIYRRDLENAYPYFEFIISQNPEESGQYFEEASLYVAQYKLNNSKDPQVMWTFLNNATTEKYISDGFSILLRFYKREKMPDNVADLYETAIKKLPNKSNWYFRYAWHNYKKNNDYSIELILKAIENDIKNPKYWQSLSILNQFNGNFKNAIESIKIAMALNPENQKYRYQFIKIIEKDYKKKKRRS